MAGRKLHIEWSQDAYDLMEDYLNGPTVEEEIIKFASDKLNKERLQMEKRMKNNNGFVWHGVDGWWFWVGSLANEHGPYKTEKKAKKKIKKIYR